MEYFYLKSTDGRTKSKSEMKRKTFFIHVAKTAGSSFNAFLKKTFVGEAHCERYLNKDATSLLNMDYLGELDYISGHLHFSLFERHFSREDYFVLTFLREPVDQLISHINWIIHIHDIGLDFFYTHPQVIQDVCLELKTVNLYDPDTFISTLNKFAWIFKNYQSRYFVENSENLCSTDVLDKLLKFDLVGLTEFYEKSLQNFVEFNQLDIDIDVDYVNRNPGYRLGKDICENALIHEFIHDYNQVDLDVYARILNQYQCSD
jgi:hypothetical protein